MSFRINTNVSFMRAYNNVSETSNLLDESLARLSSGLRINSTSDDAAGLSIANRLSAQSDGLGQAIRNANDGIGLLQTADGALDEYTNILNRMRTLAVTGANDTQDSASRGYIGDEMVKLQSELDHIANETRFNGKLILAGEDGSTTSSSTDSSSTTPVISFPFPFGRGWGWGGWGGIDPGGGGTTSSGSSSLTFTFHVGAYANQTTKVEINDMNTDKVFSHQISGLSTQGSAETIISMMDSALGMVTYLRSSLGASQNQLSSTVRNISATQINVIAAESQIRDIDFAKESANFSKLNLLMQSGSYAMTQANTIQENVLQLLQ